MVLKIISAIVLTICLFIVVEIYSSLDFPRFDNVETYRLIAEELNLRNMVTAVYLGPRLFDTFLEIFVVVMSVMGIRYLRGQD